MSLADTDLNRTLVLLKRRLAGRPGEKGSAFINLSTACFTWGCKLSG